MQRKKNEMCLENDGKNGLNTVSFYSVVFLEDPE